MYHGELDLVRLLGALAGLACSVFGIVALRTTGTTHEQAVSMAMAMILMLLVCLFVELARRKWPY